MNALLATYEGLIDDDEQAFYDNTMKFWAQYSQADEEMMKLAEQGHTEDARAILEGECVALYNSLNSSFNDIIAYNTEGSSAATEESFFLYKTAMILMAAVIIAILMAASHLAKRRQKTESKA